MSNQSLEDSMSLLSSNHLAFEAPASIAASSQRSMSLINFQPRNYANIQGSEQLSIVFNAGSSMTYGPSSMLNFKIQVNATNGNVNTDPYLWGWGNNLTTANESFYNAGGSILNLFNEVSMSARSGELLFRETYANQARTTSRLFKINKERRDYLGVMGGSSLDSEGRRKYPLYPVNREISFSIPLGELNSFFGCASPIPPQLLAGATLRLSLAKVSQCITLYNQAGTALASTNLNTVVVNINSATSYLDQCELFDSVNSLILASANSLSTAGLQYAYSTIFSNQYEVGGTGNIDIQLSAARISNVIVKFVKRTPSDWGTQNTYTSPMAASSIHDVAAVIDSDAGGLCGMKFRFRLGNQVMPLYDIETSTQSFHMVSDALSNISFASTEDPDSMKTLNKLSPCSVSFSEYTKVVGTEAGFGTGCFLIGLNMERSNCLNISGSSTSNNRILSFEYSGIKANTYNAIVSVNYLQIANVSTSNVVVNK